MLESLDGLSVLTQYFCFWIKKNKNIFYGIWFLLKSSVESEFYIQFNIQYTSAILFYFDINDATLYEKKLTQEYYFLL